jgi:hypothetical protein
MENRLKILKDSTQNCLSHVGRMEEDSILCRFLNIIQEAEEMEDELE